MVKITANGPYILESDSAGTYHELVAGQKTSAATFVQTYGEKVDAGARYEPFMAQTGPLYSCVPSGTAVAHVKVG